MGIWHPCKFLGEQKGKYRENIQGKLFKVFKRYFLSQLHGVFGHPSLSL